MFFNDISDLDDLKVMFRKLCMKHHPDKGGDADMFKLMYEEYQQVLSAMKLNADKTSPLYNSYNYDSNIDLAVWKMAESIKGSCPEAIVEIIGNWIWVSGKSWMYAAYLKTLSCRFSGGKKAWYWFSGIEKSHHSKTSRTKDVNQLRQMWHTTEINVDEVKQI